MKRDFELMGRIAEFVESAESDVESKNIEFDGYSKDQIGYHCALMVEAGLFVSSDLTVMHSTCAEFLITRLSNSGHDFVEGYRNKKVWNRVMTNVKSVAGGVSLQVVIATLSELAAGSLKL